ncbi:putative holin-like toxin [Terrilactibacillus laevilacticus]|nr:putative holin-like toxin [Terrilactibacillus laevilacticus]
MTTFETITLMINFASLVVLIESSKEKHKK